MNVTEKDLEQDKLIRQNAVNIERQEAALRRQTEALEKIRDHYYPQKKWWKKLMNFFGKVLCIVVAYLGVAEAVDWIWNTRKAETMAKQTAKVARRLFMRESDAAGAARFLEKAAELDEGTVRYRIASAYVKGIATVSGLFDLGRPLTDEERKQVDAILAEALFLQEVAPKDPMPYVMAAQALRLRREREAAVEAITKALTLSPKSGIVRINACALYFSLKDFTAARTQILEAERLDPTLPFVHFWKGQLALLEDHGLEAALAHFAEMARQYPRVALARVNLARCLMGGDKPDLDAARAELRRALSLASSPLPRKMAMLLMGETYEREGNFIVARLWLTRALEVDGRFMKALRARARVAAKEKDWKAAEEDLSTALTLSSFDSDLYGERAKAREALADAAGAAADRQKAEALRELGPNRNKPR